MHDIDIRIALKNHLIKIFGKDEINPSILIEELSICEGIVRVDVAVVNGLIHGYEIKSDSDTLERLPKQQEIYSKALDKISAVVNEKHFEKIKNLIPEWWGLMIAVEESNTTAIKSVREPRINPAVDSYSQVQFLWKDETINNLKNIGIKSSLSRKRRSELWKLLVESSSKDEVGQMVRETLKFREHWKPVRQQL